MFHIAKQAKAHVTKLAESKDTNNLTTKQDMREQSDSAAWSPSVKAKLDRRQIMGVHQQASVKGGVWGDGDDENMGRQVFDEDCVGRVVLPDGNFISSKGGPIKEGVGGDSKAVRERENILHAGRAEGGTQLEEEEGNVSHEHPCVGAKEERPVSRIRASNQEIKGDHTLHVKDHCIAESEQDGTVQLQVGNVASAIKGIQPKIDQALDGKDEMVDESTQASFSADTKAVGISTDALNVRDAAISHKGVPVNTLKAPVTKVTVIGASARPVDADPSGLVGTEQERYDQEEGGVNFNLFQDGGARSTEDAPDTRVMQRDRENLVMSDAQTRTNLTSTASESSTPQPDFAESEDAEIIKRVTSPKGSTNTYAQLSVGFLSHVGHEANISSAILTAPSGSGGPDTVAISRTPRRPDTGSSSVDPVARFRLERALSFVCVFRVYMCVCAYACAFCVRECLRVLVHVRFSVHVRIRVCVCVCECKSSGGPGTHAQV